MQVHLAKIQVEAFFYPVLWNQSTSALVVTEAGTGTLLQATFKITGKTERRERPGSQLGEVDGNLTWKMRIKSSVEDFSQLYSQPTWKKSLVKHSPGTMMCVLLLTPKWHRESSFSHLPRCWTCCVQSFWWGYWWDESNRFVKSWKKISFFSRFPPISFTSLTGVTTWWNLCLYIDILTSYIDICYCFTSTVMLTWDPTSWGCVSTFSICGCRIQIIPTLRDLGLTIADVHLHSGHIFT